MRLLMVLMWFTTTILISGAIAVSTPRGLVTPVLRDADAMSMADIEKNIKSISGEEVVMVN